MLNVTLAAPQRHQALTVFPLVTADAAELPYTLLVDALEAGTLKITEVGSGTVPELLATNKSAADILVLDGEQLIGARQNRMTNRSILLPAASEAKIPVSCMEQGRYAVLAGVVIGGELKDGERVVHLSAFPGREPTSGGAEEDGQPERPLPPIAPPSRRRRRG